MKRRGFLQMLGGAIAAPLTPSVSMGAATKAAYPASALYAAMSHAKTRVNFSVFALAKQLGLDLGQAEALMTEMSSRGILGPLQGTTQAGRWARSTVWKHPVVQTAALREAQKAKGTAPSKDSTSPASFTEPDLSHFMAHLYDICRTHGLTLHPRCAV